VVIDTVRSTVISCMWRIYAWKSLSLGVVLFSSTTTPSTDRYIYNTSACKLLR